MNERGNLENLYKENCRLREELKKAQEKNVRGVVDHASSGTRFGRNDPRKNVIPYFVLVIIITVLFWFVYWMAHSYLPVSNDAQNFIGSLLMACFISFYFVPVKKSIERLFKIAGKAE